MERTSGKIAIHFKHIVVKGGVRNGQKIKLTKIAKMASGLECKGEPVPLSSVVLTSDDVIDDGPKPSNNSNI